MNEPLAPASIVPTLESTMPSPRQRLVALGLAALLLAVSALAAPFANVQWADVPVLLPIFMVTASLAELLTAFLLFSQFQVSGRTAYLVLASSFLFSSLMEACYLLASPELSATTNVLGAAAETATWIFLTWHLLFAVGVACAVYIDRSSPTIAPAQRPARALWTLGATPLLVAALVVSAIVLKDHLPASAASGSGSVVLVVAIGALLYIAARRGGVVNLFLALSLFALCLDLTLTLLTHRRFTVGWYVARLNVIASSSVFLGLLLQEITWLYLRTSRMAERLNILAFEDALTGLANKRAFDERIALEWQRTRRDRRPLSLIMADVDNFKSYNDAYGHIAGDAALQRIAAVTHSQATRPADMVARYGGEEIVILLPDTDAAGARTVAERIRLALQGAAILHDASPSGLLTMSMGIATVRPADGAASGDLLRDADRLLYAAKNAGRDRITQD